MTEEGISIKEISPNDYERALNDYMNYMSDFIDGFVTNLFSQDIIKEIDAESLKKYFANPDLHQKDIENLAQYYYISSAEVHQLYNLIEVLPTLNYRLNSHDKSKNHEKYISILNKVLYKIKHKTLTRDLLKQEATAGTLVGVWLGDKTKPYPYIFDDLKYIFPAYRRNGEWVVQIDLTWFSEMKEFNRKMQLANLSPYVTEKDYNNFIKNGADYQYIELPQDRTFVLRTGTLKRNQNLGNSWVTSGLYDVLHKKKLKDVERSIANKIINAIAVLTIGSEKNPEETNSRLNPKLKKKIHAGVKAAIEKNQQQGVTLVSIPNYATLNFPDIKTDGLDSKKFEHIDGDIKSAYGLSGAILNGTGTNYSSAKLNLDIFHKRIGVMLEEIETEVYGKLFNLVLPKSQEDNFYMVYDKEAPLTLKEKIDILMKLNDKGWSIKTVIDHIDNVNWESYLEQTLYETEELQLQSRIQPYRSSYTMNSNEGIGREPIDNPNNENTIRSKTIDGNNLPE